MSKYGVISGPYFLVFSSNTGKYGQEISPYLDAFPAVCNTIKKTLLLRLLVVEFKFYKNPDITVVT